MPTLHDKLTVMKFLLPSKSNDKLRPRCPPPVCSGCFFWHSQPTRAECSCGIP